MFIYVNNKDKNINFFHALDKLILSYRFVLLLLLLLD